MVDGRLLSFCLSLVFLLVLDVARQLSSSNYRDGSHIAKASLKSRKNATNFNGTTTMIPVPYRNLSCPFEWSKYSCLHQGRLRQGQDSYAYTERTLRNIWMKITEDWWQDWLVSSPPSSSLTSGRHHSDTSDIRKVLLLGDSTMRQLFIGLACLLWNYNCIESYEVDWATTDRKVWPCQKTPNCIPSGPHSGFNTGHLQLRNGWQIFFLPIAAGATDKSKEQPHIVQSWNQQWNTSRQLSFSLNPTNKSAPEYNLTERDTVVYNIGLHAERGPIFQELAHLGLALRNATCSRRRHSDSDHVHVLHHDGDQTSRPPSLVYVMTITQHFPTATGMYERSKRPLWSNKVNDYVCRTTTHNNPRAVIERHRLREGLEVDWIFDPADLNLGKLHVGGNDCTHYCMPGPPDMMALRLILELVVRSQAHSFNGTSC